MDRPAGSHHLRAATASRPEHRDPAGPGVCLLRHGRNAEGRRPAVRALSPRDGFEPTSSLPTDVATGLLRANPDTTSCDGARSRPHVVGHRVSDCAVHLVPDYGSLQPGALWRI